MRAIGVAAGWMTAIAISGSVLASPAEPDTVRCRAASDPFDAIMLDPSGTDLFLRRPSFGIQTGLRVRFSLARLIAAADPHWRPIVRQYLGDQARFPASLHVRGDGCLDRLHRVLVPLSLTFAEVRGLAM